MNRPGILFLSILMITSMLTVSVPVAGQNTETWHIVASKSLMKEETIKVVLEDLQQTGKQFGLQFKIVNDDAAVSGNSIIIGVPARNKHAALLVKKMKIQL